MNDFFRLMVRKKLQVFFLFYLIMVLPVLAFGAENLTFVDSLEIFVVNTLLFLSIVILTSFVKSRTEKTIYLLLFVISCIPSAIYMGYLLFANVLLQKNSIISLFETNPEESREFVTHYFNPWLIFGLIMYVLLCFVMIWKMKARVPLLVKSNKCIFILASILLIATVVIPSLSTKVYFVNFYKVFVAYKLQLNYEHKAIAERNEIDYKVEKLYNNSSPQTIILVIGESLTRSHLSLYGYNRDTNKQLEKLGDSLTVYADVISPQVHTIPVMRSVLTFMDRDNPDFITEKPSLFELFNRAGYDTYLLGNQAMGGQFRTSYESLFEEAKHIYNFAMEKQSDEIMLPKLKEILGINNHKNKFILIHLIGNHMAYEFRYTPTFNVFDNTKDNLIGSTPFRDDKAKKTIDRYDNSVLYNDYVISKIIKLLQTGCYDNAAMIYFADHGEEVFDNRKFAGHAYEKISSYMCEIPFLMWLSPVYKKLRPDLVIDTSRPYSTCDVIHSISDLAGLLYQDYDDSKSIFSDRFIPSERYVGDYTYDEVKSKN